ncbi:hypothetical protein [Psychrobacillus soli]|uniref:Uncharacterized protein n=1 Tax=Psychrobacillus soli TaxID=1543965 RepID=A0A544TDS6_9BACI|nr:hypothetical protein [Psychrobacillus soli]TQR15602.1 hypothetical protein FG383_08395 [Psychrobacillus soli]
MTRLILFLLGVSLVITGCTPDNSVSEQEGVLIKAEENNQATPIIDRQYDFTYLEELPSDKLDSYNDYLLNGSINSLSDFTPEEMILIYMNLILEHKIDRLYALTYNGGQLPSVELFNDEYMKYLSSNLEEAYLMYRFYDAISINEQSSTEDVIIVQLEIIFGSKRYIKTYPLKQEDGIWKVAIYQSLKQ